MTPDVIRAFEISGGVLLGVIVLIVIVSIAAVNRGDAKLSGNAGDRRH
jgi:hypothetical protein